MQSSTTPDPGYQWESDKLTEDTTNEIRVQIRFSKSLGEILGLNPDLSNKVIGSDNQVFTYAVDLNMTHHQMFVYSDVADYTYVGNITALYLELFLINSQNLALNRIKNL